MLKTCLLKHYKTAAFWLGVASASALPPFYCLPVLFFTFPTLLFQINGAKTKKQAFASGYWFGFGYFAVNLSWIGNALLIEAETFGWLYPITILASGAFFGLFTAFPALTAYLFNNRLSRWLAFAAAWIVFEWIRSFIFTGFPWNLLGSVLAFSTGLIQTASLFGTYGLSLCMLLVCGSPFLIFSADKKQRLTGIITALSLIVFISAYGFWRTNGYIYAPSSTRLRLVQPSIPQSMKWNKETLEQNLREYISLSRENGFENIDFVIWGETASPFPLDFDFRRLQEVTAAVPPQGYLLTGSIRYELSADGSYRPLNSMFAINDAGRIVGTYDKAHLVPFGEYVPFKQFLPESFRPVAQSLADFKAGSGPKSISIAGHPRFGPLICYEIIFPYQVINKKNPPQWLVNFTNDGWYGNSQGPHQHLVTTRFRAVEEGLTVVRAANSGISAVISPVGEVLAAIPLNAKQTLDFNLPNRPTVPVVYGKFGNIIPLSLAVVCLLIAFIVAKRHHLNTSTCI